MNVVPLNASPNPVPNGPVAKLYGEPVIELPHDLYIPPDALEVVLEAFEGPLDLLLYLIRKENLDILDIPMAPLTRQYLEYVDLMKVRNLELAAEYLVMAAMLMEIKSRLLLPRPPSAEATEEDPRAELVRRLLEYEQMKKAAQKLDELPHVGRDVIAISVWIEIERMSRPARGSSSSFCAASFICSYSSRRRTSSARGSSSVGSAAGGRGSSRRDLISARIAAMTKYSAASSSFISCIISMYSRYWRVSGAIGISRMSRFCLRMR